MHVVVDDALPGPPLSVAPAHTGWQVWPGAGPVTDTLTVTNVGGGLKWTVTTDATWLKLGAAGGDTPGTLPISTDPQLLADGTTLTATIVVTALDGDGAPVGTMPVLVGCRPRQGRKRERSGWEPTGGR